MVKRPAASPPCPCGNLTSIELWGRNSEFMQMWRKQLEITGTRYYPIEPDNNQSFDLMNVSGPRTCRVSSVGGFVSADH